MLEIGAVWRPLTAFWYGLTNSVSSATRNQKPSTRKMPPRTTWDEVNPRIERRGFTDYLETNEGWKPIRVFDGRGHGRFRLTRIGKRFYHEHTLNEYVIQLPALFRTYKDAGVVEHRGFYPIHALPPNIRARLDLVFEGWQSG